MGFSSKTQFHGFFINLSNAIETFWVEERKTQNAQPKLPLVLSMRSKLLYIHYKTWLKPNDKKNWKPGVQAPSSNWAFLFCLRKRSKIAAFSKIQVFRSDFGVFRIRSIDPNFQISPSKAQSANLLQLRVPRWPWGRLKGFNLDQNLQFIKQMEISNYLLKIYS